MGDEGESVHPGGGEFDLIRWFRERTNGHDSFVLGIGDDCAILRFLPSRDVVVTTDMLMDGRHFRLDQDGAEAVAYKAVAVNVSDIAAMAARPVAMLVAIALPNRDGRAYEIGLRLHKGFYAAAERFHLGLAGGDTNAWDGPLVLTVTALGETTGRGAVRRTGARIGDVIAVTGPLGGSILGRHLRPTPRVDEAVALHAAARLRALIDISDGLASDLTHILEESGLGGAVLDEEMIPIHPDAITLSAKTGKSPVEHALNDGEDFELCLVVSPEDAARLADDPPPPAEFYPVGHVTDENGLWLRGRDGVVRRIEPRGFDHLKG